MSICVFDDDTVCRNENFENNYGHRCVEANNITRNERVYCTYHHDGYKIIATPEKPDNVHSPAHYCQGGIECIKAIEASMSPEEFQGYCKGNVMKYIWRFREKNGLEDLKKAQVYLGWMIESKEKQEKTK